MADEPLLIRLAGSAPPPGLLALAQVANAEGVGIPARVVREWAQGVRFDRPNEALLGATPVPATPTATPIATLAAIGGITHDPAWPGALRMRRFYVHPAFRRRGLARRIARTLLADVPPGRLVTVHAGTPDAPGFWTSLGFTFDPALGLHRRSPP